MATPRHENELNNKVALYGKHENLKLGGDPSDSAWRWFILNGPHGERFQWTRFGALPRDIEFLEKFINEREDTDFGFREKIREISLKSLDLDNITLIRTAIQVLTIVGNDDDIKLVAQFVEDENIDIQNDAKCALFERGIKLTKLKSKD